MNRKKVNYLLILIIALGAIYYVKVYSARDTSIVDDTEYYKLKNEALEEIIKEQKELIKYKDEIIFQKQEESDSLIQYQHKIYKYYAKEINNLRSVPDSSVVEFFTGLISNR